MVSEQKMQDLAQEIVNTLQKVTQGRASLDEVETLYKNSRGLYERAILLKARAFSGSDLSMPEVQEKTEEKVTEATAEQPEAPQPTAEAVQEEKEKEAPKDMPLFDFAAMSEEEENQNTPEPKENTVVPADEEHAQPETKEEAPSVNDHQDVIDSINDAYKHAEDNSLLEDMKRQPITDLRTAIGINDKFSYINDLFNGENQLYEVALDQLEQLESADGAKHKLSELAIVNEWDLESKTVMQFVELVERRYATAE